MQEEAKLIESKAVYEFDCFRVDPTNRLFWRDGEVVPLTAKVFDLLLLFIENNGRLLAKDDLMRRLWPQSFVEEGNLTTNVSILRKALGETPKSHHYLVTVPGHGYKFVATIKEVQETPAVTVIAEQTISTTVIEEEISLPTIAQAPRALSGTQEEATAINETKKRQTRRWFWAIPVVAVLLTFVWISKERLFTPTKQIKSLTILPLKSLDESGKYLGAGIADGVIRRISQTGQLTVRPMSAVWHYLNEDKNSLAAARELNTDAVLEGSVQHADDRLRVSINLIRTIDGKSLWADSFDMRGTDIFMVQDKVAQQIVSRLQIQLDPAQQAGLSKRYTSSAIAHDYCIKGIYNLDLRGSGDMAKPQMEDTITFFKKAIEADPDYALAHAQLAWAYAWTAGFIEPNEPKWAELAKAEIKRSQTLDSQLAETHLANAVLLWSAYENYQNDAAIRELLLAKQLDPNSGHGELAAIYGHMGLENLASRELQHALDTDPTSQSLNDLKLILPYLGGKYDEWFAAEQELNPPGSPDVWYLLGKSRLDDAAKVIDSYVAKAPDAPNVQKALLFALRGEFRAAEAEVPRILAKQARNVPSYHHITYNIACIYALAGKSGEAVKWLKETAAMGFPNYPLFERDHYLDRIRQTPEFVQFMALERAQWEQYRQEFGD